MTTFSNDKDLTSFADSKRWVQVANLNPRRVANLNPRRIDWIMAKENTRPQNPVNPVHPVEKNTVQFTNYPDTGSN